LSLLATRDVKREYIHDVVARAGVDLTPLAAWLLVRIDLDPGVDVAALSAARRLDAGRTNAAVDELLSKELVREVPATGETGRRHLVTRTGCSVLERLVDARRARLTEVISEWAPEKRAELAAAVPRLTRELVPDAPREV
jgi:hypothetical protein